MSLLLLRVLERVHGHLGWLAVAALLHPAILLRKPRRRARASVVLATLAVLATGLLGGTIYPSYRSRLKQHLFVEAPRVGWMFERKEHLAVGAIAFALVGLVAHLAAPGFERDASRLALGRLAHRSYVVAFALALAVATIGVAVASRTSF